MLAMAARQLSLRCLLPLFFGLAIALELELVDNSASPERHHHDYAVRLSGTFDKDVKDTHVKHHHEHHKHRSGALLREEGFAKLGDVQDPNSGDGYDASVANNNAGGSDTLEVANDDNTIEDNENKLEKMDTLVTDAATQAGIASKDLTTAPPQEKQYSSSEVQALMLVSLGLIGICCVWSVAWFILAQRIAGAQKASNRV